jgi:ABC-2 type transport system permease protein
MIFTHSLIMTMRNLRGLVRQPIYVAFTLVQPVFWLVLYGQLFQRVVELRGFNASSYIVFLTPGIVIMTALMSGGWNGMGIINEIERGVMDRFLVSPISRFALIAGRLIALGAVAVIQSLLLMGLGFLLGARFDGGIAGCAVMIACAVLLAASFGALSNALAVVVRKPESVIGASNFVLLPLTFLSPVFMAKNVMPAWIRVFAGVNPVAWSVEAARSAMSAHTDWGAVGMRAAGLVCFALLSAGLATRAFRAYQRSV